MPRMRLRPLKAIRQFCCHCVGSSNEVRDCQGDTIIGVNPDGYWTCPLHEYRFGHKPVKSLLSPLKAIHRHCVYCMGGSNEEIKLCVDDDCFLHPFKLGHNPNRKGIGGNKLLKPNLDESKQCVS